MKKSFFFALAVAGMLSSCSSEDVISDGAGVITDGENSELVPIQLGVSSNAITGTRGTGTVGDIQTDNTATISQWKGQQVKVLMLASDFSVAQFSSANAESVLNGDIFNNTVMNTPTDGTGYAKCANGSIKYYPANGAYSFWGYRIDDEANVDAVNNGDGTWSANFTIDGSQDVMVGKTVITDNDKAAMTAGGFGEDRLYSAFAARHGVQPTLEFRHLLTRLEFHVWDEGLRNNILLSNNESTDLSDITLNRILVRSHKTGKLIVAYQAEPENGVIEFTDELTEWSGTDATDANLLALQERASDDDVTENLQKLSPVQLTGTNGVVDENKIGEALLVAPQDEYDVLFELKQAVVTEEGGEAQDEIYLVPGKIALTTGSFLAGYSYSVNVALYGLQEILITTTLTPWEDGGSIDIVPEDQDIND